MVDTDELKEEDFLRIAEIVASVAGVSREQVQVIQHR